MKNLWFDVQLFKKLAGRIADVYRVVEYQDGRIRLRTSDAYISQDVSSSSPIRSMILETMLSWRDWISRRELILMSED